MSAEVSKSCLMENKIITYVIRVPGTITGELYIEVAGNNEKLPEMVLP